MLKPSPLPGLFITGTDTGVGKTIISCAIARHLVSQNHRVAVLKPAATDCPHRREGLVSEDAELLAHFAKSSFPLDLICPQRFHEPLAPAVAARRAGQPLEWDTIQRSIDLMTPGNELLIVEGAGGVCVPMDENSMVIDVMRWLKLPAVIVARPALGTINHTVLTVRALKEQGIAIAGIVINRYPAESPSVAEETNLREVEKWAKVPVLAIVPDEKFEPGTLSPGILSAIDQVDWSSKCKLAN